MTIRRSQLASISKIRAAHRDAQRLRLADALRAEAELTNQQTAIESESLALSQTQRTLLENQGLNVNALLDLERYELVLRAHATALTRQVEAVQAETERRRLQLAQADQEVRVIEKLEEKRLQEQAKELARKEQHKIDEAASTLYLRNRG